MTSATRPWLSSMVLAALGSLGGAAGAEQVSDTNSPYSVSARLDFRINIGRYLYVRVGPTGAGLATVAFAASATLPNAPTTAVTGNNQPVPWNGAAPSFSTTASNNVLPVQIGSNAGTVSLQATVLSALSNGVSTLPMNSIAIASDNAGLPAPALPAAGTGSASTVTGTAFGGLVTQQSANWTFTFTATPAMRAGAYSGQVGFTASVP